MSDLISIAVCGAGAMGSGIAQVAAQAGHEVTVFDTSESALTRGREGVDKALAGLVKRDRMTPDDASALAARIIWSTQIEDLSGADLVIEAIIEDAAIKSQLFDRIEAVVSERTVIATNTSSLAVTPLASKRASPARFLGLHFFNPAPVMKLVEVIPGVETAPDLIAEMTRLMSAWGKSPVAARDVPGFIVNRVARPYYAEGFRALAEAAAAPEVIDHLFRKAARFRMGPLELADMIGHDVNFAVARSVYEAYFGATRFTPQLAQGALVDAGRLGRKSGRGVYDYGAGGVPELAPVEQAAQPRRIVIGDAVDLRLAELCEGIGGVAGAAPEGLIDVDGTLVGISDGRTAATLSAIHARPVALLDWMASDAEACGYAVSGAEARAAVLGLLAAVGREAREISDRPGLVVLRTLAQLANAAGDAVRDQVADPDGIDQALRFGANYPFGPLAWARAFGHARLILTLENIARETGDARYLPSEYFRRPA